MLPTQGRLSQTVAGLVACVDAGAHMKMTPAGSASGTWFTIEAMGSPSPSGGRSECTNPPPVNLRLSVSLGPAGVRCDAGTTAVAPPSASVSQKLQKALIRRACGVGQPSGGGESLWAPAGQAWGAAGEWHAHRCQEV